MDNYIKSYDDNSEQQWTTLSEIVTKDELTATGDELLGEPTAEGESTNIKHGRKISSPVLTFQLIFCMAVLILMFLSKTFAADIFDEIKSWYDTEMYATMFLNGDFSQFDYSSLFISTNDEV